MKIVKILLIIVAAVILLVISAVGIFVATFDANQYKQELSGIVKQKTGRDLEFKGDIGLTLYPSLGMKLGSMNFSNAAGFGNEPMLAVNNASVSVDVLSLLSFEPKIAQLILDGLNVNLQKNKQGVTNWDDLIPQAQPAKPAVASPDKSSDVDVKPADGIDLQAAFDGLSVTNVNLVWSDAVAGAKYQIRIASLLTGKIAPKQSFPLRLNMSVESVNEVSADIALKTDVMFDRNKISMNGLQLDSTARGALIPVKQLLLMVKGDVSFSQLTQQLSISAFNSSIQTTGGVLDSSKTTIAGEIGFDLKQQQLTIAVLDIQSELKGAAVPNKAMKAAVSASKLDVQLNKRSVVLDDLVLALNENRFKGYLKVLDYQQPNVEFNLKADKFDVDSLLGAKSEATVEQPQPTEQAVAKDVQITLPMELLRSLKLNGKLAVTTLIAQGLTVNNIVVSMNANKGLVNLEPLKMDLYEGTFDGAININAQGDKPAYTVRNKLSSFRIGRFLKDFMGNDPVSGSTDLKLNLTTRGDWLSQLKTNLNGDLSILIKDGSLKGFNLRQKIEVARAKLKNEKEPELIERKTDFSSLSISGLIKDGVFSTDDLNLQAPLIRVGGKGSVDIARETVNYLVNAKVVTTIKGQDGGTADELSGIPVPVAITGPWISPKIDIQYDEMLKARLNAEKDKVRESIAKQQAELGAKLAAEKAKLKESEEKALAAKKLQLEKKKDLLEAEQKAKLDAKTAAEKEKARKKLEDKLKNLF